MSVKLTNFVQININRHLANRPLGARDVAVLYYYKEGATPGALDKILTKDNYLPYIAPAGATTDAGALFNIANYITTFFNNNGRKLYVYITNDDPEHETVEGTMKGVLDALPMEYCVVGIIGASGNIEGLHSVVKNYNKSHEEDKIYQKLFIVDSLTSNINLYIDSVNHKNVYALDNFVIKLQDSNSPCAAAAALAYYTQFNIYSADATQDYAYTVEKFGEITGMVSSDNAVVKKAMDYNMNIDIKLAGEVRNVGGNDTAGNDLTNQFMLLVLHQTLTERLVGLLAQKIRYNDKGIAAVINAITKELNAYVFNGFLTTNKVWTDGDLYHGNYKIIDDNTMLNAGYKITVMPYESLSDEEKEAHQLPEIYILIADSYSIRKIVITGEVF